MVRVPAEGASEPDSGAVITPPRLGSGTTRVEYFTDPLCCWSWALEPVWREIRRTRPDLGWRVVLGGMIESWATFRDPMNDVSRAPQLAPLWHMAARRTGVRMDPGIWHVDPPASSYPASVAVKAAGLQGEAAGLHYLGRVREAVMTRRLNVARRDVLVRIADELSASAPGFDARRFAADLVGNAAQEAFRLDLERVRFLRIGRFPTTVVHGAQGSRVAVGYRPLEAMERLLASVSRSEREQAG